jgi:hypothetical protein
MTQNPQQLATPPVHYLLLFNKFERGDSLYKQLTLFNGNVFCLVTFLIYAGILPRIFP